MTYTLSVRSEAEYDIGEAFDYYHEISTELGNDFVKCLDSAIKKVQKHPQHYRRIYKDIRRIPLRRFPYRVFYRVVGRHIIIIAIFHVRKDPTQWKLRS